MNFFKNISEKYHNPNLYTTFKPKYPGIDNCNRHETLLPGNTKGLLI